MNLRNATIKAGVKNIREHYPSVTEENILTDQIYSAFFAESLRMTKGHDKRIDAVCDELLGEISTNDTARE